MNQPHTTPGLSRRLLAEFYDDHPQATVWLEPIWSGDSKTIIDFEYIYCNEEGLKYLSLEPELQPGMRISNTSTLTDSVRPIILNEMIEIMQTGVKSERTFFNAALNKYVRVVRSRLRGGILTVVKDLTQENHVIRQLEEQTQQIQAQKNLLDNILRYSSNGISVGEMIRDSSGNIADIRTILANDAAVLFTGISKELYLTKSGSELDPNFASSAYFRQCVRCMETGEPFITQYYFQPINRWLEVSVSRMNAEHQIYVFTDVTTVKESQLKLEQTIEELRRTNENLEEFTRAASHDLKEPIRKVHYFTERLKASLQGRLSEDEERILQRVENASERMRLLVDDLLIYAQLNSNTQLLEEVDLNKKISVILSDLELVVNEKKAVIERDTLPTVKGYRRQLQQLFQNLVSNALKYSKPNEPPYVQIRTKEVTGDTSGLEVAPEDKDKPFYLIEVKDNGIGFEQQYAERIFQVFTRLHGRHEYQGSGVGLAIVKKVVDNHKGYIAAEGEPGKAATFRVLLPKM